MSIFETSHFYFEEVLEYQMLLVGLASTMPLKSAHQTIRNLGDVVEKLNTDKSVSVEGKVFLPEIPAKFSLAQGRNSDIVTLYGCDGVFKFISGQASKPKRVRFSVRKNRLRSDVPEQRRRAVGTLPLSPDQVRESGADLMTLLVLISANLLGGSYEKCKSRIEQKFTTNVSSWPQELQFFRHLRNGCFHGNHFNITKRRGRNAIDKNAPPKWHLYTMSDDTTMNGQQAVGGFFPHNQLVPFLYQIGNII
jgi:hypothetical protein